MKMGLMTDRSALFSRQLAAAARAMQSVAGSKDTLAEAVAAATDIIGGCDLAGVAVAHRHGIEIPAASDETVQRIDELQYELGEGPCLTALRDHETIYSPDVVDDQRWPGWGRRIADDPGVQSAVGYRLFTTEDTLGALDLYSRKLDGFEPDDIENGLALAAHVAIALAGAQNIEQIERALDSRSMIGQAEGILMERFHISAVAAFSVLRRVSQEHNVKLREVVAHLVDTRKTPR